MDVDLPRFSCVCGKTFEQQNALSNHTRCCARSKEQISWALEAAKVRWAAKQKERARKRRRSESDSELELELEETTADADQGGLTDEEEDEIESNTDDQFHDLHLSIAARRVRRKKNPPKRFRDDSPTPMNSPSIDSPADTPGLTPREDSPSSEIAAGVSTQSHVHQTTEPLVTSPNRFGMYRKLYLSTTHDPEQELTSADFSDILNDAANETHTITNSDLYMPYPNKSSFLLGEWFWGNKGKTLSDFQKLLSIISDAEFSLQDVRNTHWDAVNTELGSDGDSASENPLSLDASWIREEVCINVPFTRGSIEPGPRAYTVGHFYRRSIVSIMRERLAEPDSRHFHLGPEEVQWKPNATQPAQRVYWEIYNSPKFIEEHLKLQNLPPEPNCTLQRVVVALLFATDETHLTQFGNTKLYPLYLHFGNNSKYLRARTSRHLCNHVAYFTKLPADFREYYRKNSGGRAPSQNLVPHCLREAIHAQWGSILDDEFIEAYKHGCVITCGFDGRKRRFYPRIFAISADYQEKVRLTGIRGIKSDHPCPRCLIPKEYFHHMGMPRDRSWRETRRRIDDEHYRDKISDAQDAIYHDNYAIKSDQVEKLLKPDSLNPCLNAFSKRLSGLGFNFFEVFPVDFMHEVESGTWASLFVHLLRMVQSLGGHLLDEVDSRYRQTPVFGRDAIRKFRRNTSGLGHMATHEWEDLLQCAIPVFDHLFSGPNNAKILKLLFVFASWHGIAKLRIHTDGTLILLDQLTTDLGNLMRQFDLQVCPQYATKELAKETQERWRRKISKAKKKGQTTLPGTKQRRQGASSDLSQSKIQTRSRSKRVQNSEHSREGEEEAQSIGDCIALEEEAKSTKLSLLTYKFHAMGDYVESIHELGTVDSYSTESGELEHRTPKSQYSRTSKKDYVKQITQIERRQARIRRIRSKLHNETQKGQSNECGQILENDNTSSIRYHIGVSENDSTHIPHFLHQNFGDPAIADFLPGLKSHLLSRIDGANSHNQGTDVALFFQKDRMYNHKTIRINYTTYDVRREQDVVNPSSGQCNIMLLHPALDHQPQGSNSIHPFLYARVIKIFHVNVILSQGDPASQRMDCLWVRWYRHQEAESPFSLHRAKLVRLSEKGACGFVNPADVVRACHIAPRFSKGRTFSVGDNGTSRLAMDKDDWEEYYISQFADRDLLMRFHWGMAIGHTYSFEGTTSRLVSTFPRAEADDTQSEEAEKRLEKTHENEEIGQRLGYGDDSDESEEDSDEFEDGSQNAESEASDDDLNDEEFADRHLTYRDM